MGLLFVQAVQAVGDVPVMAAYLLLVGLIFVAINLALAIGTEATLSFLGSGLPPTTPSLGTLIRTGGEHLFSGEWWMAAFPGAALAGLALGVTLMGYGLRDALNPRLR